MTAFNMVLACRPFSANRGPNTRYIDALRGAALARSPAILARPLYARILWFHKDQTSQDADNIVKRILDGLKGIVFADDVAVSHCLAARIDATIHYVLSGSPPSEPDAELLLRLLDDNASRDVLYLEDDQKADLVARKPGAATIVYEFKLPAKLHANSEQIRRLRTAAAEKAFEFKLMVVTPPKRVDVTVEGLPEALDSAFLEWLDSTRLASLASHVEVEDVSDVEITSLNVRGEHTDVAGHAVVDVRLDYDAGESRDGVTTYDSFPFEFDITLNAKHKAVEIRKLEVDTSSFYD